MLKKTALMRPEDVLAAAQLNTFLGLGRPSKLGLLSTCVGVWGGVLRGRLAQRSIGSE